MEMFDEMLAERNEALRSIDKEKILAYAEKYRIRWPKDEEIFWAAVHKARLHVTTVPDDEKDKSRQWLKEHGFRTWVEG
jgi:hypothetical protein